MGERQNTFASIDNAIQKVLIGVTLTRTIVNMQQMIGCKSHY